MKLLAGKTALVTGASRGIGKGIAMKLAEAGANIAFTYRSSVEKANVLAAEIEKTGVKCRAYQSDAGSFEDAAKLIENILNEFGQIDVVVNNAGITQDNLIMRMSEEQWDKVIETNLKSVFNITKNVARPMMKARSGSIINITSIVGVKGNAGQSNYAASKAGIIGFTKSIALELGGRNIRSNAIAPGFIETEMTEALDEATREKYFSSIPLKRLGTTEEVANVVLFLASDMSSYVTGQTISVCGALNT
jgi:3-oxoacyl-[acyl-carrier protein] reductase